MGNGRTFTELSIVEGTPLNFISHRVVIPRRLTDILRKIFNRVKKWQIPRVINTDKAAPYGRALNLLKDERKCPACVEHRQIKFHSNLIECDHGKLKRVINPTLGFKSIKTAHATIKGIEVMRALRKGQAEHFYMTNR